MKNGLSSGHDEEDKYHSRMDEHGGVGTQEVKVDLN